MLAAAQAHEVWVLTRQNNLQALQSFLNGDPRGDGIHLIGCDLGPGWRRLKQRGRMGLHLYYDAWQRRAAVVGARLHREVGFDVVHHATFAADWSRVGVARVGPPLIWGPVGGAVRAPGSLRPVLGHRGRLAEAARVAVRPAMRRVRGTDRIAARARSC
jgi:hypothetical protein